MLQQAGSSADNDDDDDDNTQYDRQAPVLPEELDFEWYLVNYFVNSFSYLIKYVAEISRCSTKLC